MEGRSQAAQSYDAEFYAGSVNATNMRKPKPIRGRRFEVYDGAQSHLVTIPLGGF